MGPLPNGHSWLMNGGDPNYLLAGMILQVWYTWICMFDVKGTNSKNIIPNGGETRQYTYLAFALFFYGKCR